MGPTGETSASETDTIEREATGITSAGRRRPVRNQATNSDPDRITDQPNDFIELSRKVKDAGLMDRKAGSYVLRLVILSVAFAGAVTLLVTLGNTAWQLAVAALFGILFTQLAFLSHDSAHQQVFSTGRRNEWFSRIVGNLGVGLSYGWWVKKHNRHHALPNTIGRDGDIATGALVFVPGEAEGRKGFMGWITRRQGWLFFPLLSLFAFSLHYNAVRTVLLAPKVKHRVLEAVLVAVRLIGFPALVFLALGPWLGLGFLAVQLAVFGIYMGGSFAPNHKGMPLIPKDEKVDFLRRQVLTSRNIRGGLLVEWAMGGLNYQIEHHLFPRMPSMNLRKVRPIVREFCSERDIPYTETGIVGAYVIVIRYLNRVGLGHADPMECPITAQYRPS
ncbi:acyl-CoA desaturase [uncultured Agrococcus sp.]|uniref:fatty acid desaturase family protein n=1 Tax=uncultured Agrococcus sp. TaxID=382258 RepID=UPI0025F9E9BA|nr:acyl-CoA desaturase [uncultured Agrococcus sp.]